MRATKGAIACLLCQPLYNRGPSCALWVLQGLRPGHSTTPTHSLTVYEQSNMIMFAVLAMFPSLLHMGVHCNLQQVELCPAQ